MDYLLAEFDPILAPVPGHRDARDEIYIPQCTRDVEDGAPDSEETYDAPYSSAVHVIGRLTVRLNGRDRRA